MKHLKTNTMPDESRMPSTKEHSVPTHMTDSEHAAWTDRVGEELARNLNEHIRQEQIEDQERQRKAQK
jgi:hypothetical protein